jgi:hypothetical protein
MTIRYLYHGANGDNILSIIRARQMRPANGEIFFSQHRFDSVLMHGADLKRRATFAVKLRVCLPPNATLEQRATHGVADTLIVHTTEPVSVEVVELYVREPRSAGVQTIRGTEDITQFLNARAVEE